MYKEKFKLKTANSPDLELYAQIMALANSSLADDMENMDIKAWVLGRIYFKELFVHKLVVKIYL